MRLQESLGCIAELPRPDDFDRFQRSIEPSWREEALLATGTATVRKRRLPAEYVLWLVIGMALSRDRSIADVLSSLNLSMPKKGRLNLTPGVMPPRETASASLIQSGSSLPFFCAQCRLRVL